jgi:hypothetical protein
MKWGDIQSLLGVIIGLNIAYSAFRELRAPYVSALKVKTQELDTRVAKQTDDVASEREYNKPSKVPNTYEISQELLKIQQEVFKLRDEVTVFYAVTSGRRFDYLFGLPAMIVGLLGVVFLIISTIKFEQPLSLLIFWMIAIIGLLPIGVLIGSNYLLVWLVVRQFEVKYSALHKRYFSFFVDRILEHDLTIAQAKYDLDRSKHSPH